MKHFAPYHNHQIIEKSFHAFKKPGREDVESLRLEHAREAQHADANKSLQGKYIKVKDQFGGLPTLFKVISIKECGGGAQTLFTLLVVNGEQYHSRVVHGGDVSLLAMTELPVYVETEIWVESSC